MSEDKPKIFGKAYTPGSDPKPKADSPADPEPPKPQSIFSQKKIEPIDPPSDPLAPEIPSDPLEAQKPGSIQPPLPKTLGSASLSQDNPGATSEESSILPPLPQAEEPTSLDKEEEASEPPKPTASSIFGKKPETPLKPSASKEEAPKSELAEPSSPLQKDEETKDEKEEKSQATAPPSGSPLKKALASLSAQKPPAPVFKSEPAPASPVAPQASPPAQPPAPAPAPLPQPSAYPAPTPMPHGMPAAPAPSPAQHQPQPHPHSHTPSPYAPQAHPAGGSNELITPKDRDEAVVIPNGTEIEGNIRTDRPIIIQGRIGGTGRSGGTIQNNALIYVGKDAKVEADILCDKLEVYGSADGDITAREEILLHAGGKLMGKIHTPNFRTEPGSVFRGTMEMTGNESIETKSLTPRRSESESEYQPVAPRGKRT